MDWLLKAAIAVLLIGTLAGIMAFVRAFRAAPPESVLQNFYSRFEKERRS